MISILMLEDNQVAQFAHTYYLTPRGFYIDCASDGKQVLEKLKKNSRYHIILLDSIVPKRESLKVCRKIRAQREYRTIPIVAYTTGDETIDNQYLDAGVNKVIKKPTPLRNLLKILKSYVINKTC